ncbi:protein NEN1-like [Canna indica]|uniref:Protein NEN1-like n=1 Tax=Canna indica TaxID=4628 RepID=A0AAQ3JRC6_9LILI|nr:protein NEN1-like [Canna indica]
MESVGSEIAFFDVETTVPSRSSGGGYSLLEFGVILVCPRRLVEVDNYSTLIRPLDLRAISAISIRCNGITRDAVTAAPLFRDVAAHVFKFLNGRVWAGHNIARFDCARIREAFAEIGRPAPEPKGIIDTLPFLTQKFGRRAGDMKMASLATYFELGQQKHRSLEDVRMNLEVLKYCAAVLFLESSLPDIFSIANMVQNNMTPKIEVNGTASTDQNPNSSGDLLNSRQQLDLINNQVIVEGNDRAGSSNPVPKGDPSNLVAHMEQMKIDFLQRDTTLFRGPAHNSGMQGDTIPTHESSSSCSGFLVPDQVFPWQISASIIHHQNSRKINLLYRDCPLQLCCLGMRIHFGVSSKFIDHAGRPKLSIVVGAPENLCKVLDICDQVAQVSSQNSGSDSEWRPVLKRNGFSNTFNIRLHIPTVANGDGATYSTEMYQKDPCGNMQKLVFSKLDAAELDSIFVPGTYVDAYFFTDIYDFQQIAGIRLVARRLVVLSR